MYWIKNNTDYVIGAVQPENSIQVPKRPTSAHSWNGSQWVFDGFTAEQSMNSLRAERNKRLAQTDWRASSDLTLSSEWATYRQALRDLPANSTPTLDSDGNLQNVNWPSEPS